MKDLLKLFKQQSPVEDFDATTLRTQAQKSAFWMNAYNVQMLQNIIETPQVNNIIDDGFADAFFDTAFLTAGSKPKSNLYRSFRMRPASLIAWYRCSQARASRPSCLA